MFSQHIVVIMIVGCFNSSILSSSIITSLNERTKHSSLEVLEILLIGFLIAALGLFFSAAAECLEDFREIIHVDLLDDPAIK